MVLLSAFPVVAAGLFFIINIVQDQQPWNLKFIIYPKNRYNASS